MSDAQVRSLARRLQRLEKQTLQRKLPTLGFSSIDDGAITSVDVDGNLQMIIGQQFDQTQTSAVVAGPNPPTPLLPFVTEQAGALRIYWDGTFVPEGTVAPMDFARVLAYAVPSADFVIANPLDQAAIVGQFTSATGGEITAALNPGEEYVVFLATWSQAGKFSVPSDAVTATVGIAEGVPGEQGIPGPPGDDGQSLYTWLKYADTPTTGMSDSPTGKTYMGLAFNKVSATESTDYADYSWSLIKGADGAPGSPGTPGTPGASLYTWVKYADSSTGTGLNDSPTGKNYIGLAYNKTSATESTVPADYTWSLFRGTPDPTAAPPSSPLITVTGTTAAFVVEAEDTDPGTRIQYHVSATQTFTPGPSTLYVTTAAQVAVITSLPSGGPFDIASPYFFKVIAENDIGVATASPEVSANINLENIDTVVAEKLVAGFILTGQIQIGQILIDADDGISINQPGGGYSLKFPSNGVDPLEIVAQIVTNKLTVEDNLSIGGNAQLLGDLELANGITNPVGQPGISNYYPSISTTLNDGFNAHNGMVEDPVNANNFVTSIAFLGSGLRFVNKYTGEIASVDPTVGKAWVSNFDAWGGITYLSGYYYIFGQDRNRPLDFVTNRTFVYKINATTFDKAGELELYDSSVFGDYRPRIASDGVAIYIFWVNSSKVLRFRRTGNMSTWDTATSLITLSSRRSVADVVYGNIDGIGSARWWIALDGGTDPVYSYTANSAGPLARSATYDFEKATNGLAGMVYDSARSQMLSVDRDGYLYRYGRYPTDKSIIGKYAWLDDDATGGTHETVPGPTRIQTIKARAYINTTVTSPPDLLNTDALNTDKANKVAGYFTDDVGVTWRRKVYQSSRTMTSTRTSGSATISGSFTDADIGSMVVGTGIPAAATIKYRLSATQAVLTAQATTSTSGSVTVTPQAPWGTTVPLLSELALGTPKVTNEFLTSTLATPGKVTSVAETASAVDGMIEIIHLKGDGSFRLGNYSSVRHAGARAMTGTQTLTTGTVTVISFGSTKEAATGVTWDGTNSRWIINKPGVYMVNLGINWASSTTGRRQAMIYKNGAAYSIAESGAAVFTSGTMNQVVSAIVPCVAGDYIEARALQNSGGNLTVNAALDDFRHFFSISFIQT